ncbi:hypothetical protein WN943_006449 [Citrus x changshan-huyou]
MTSFTTIVLTKKSNPLRNFEHKNRKMKNSNEEQEDRDDLEYPVTTQADIDGWWNVSSNDEGEAHNDESGSIELQADINSEMGTNQKQTDRQ